MLYGFRIRRSCGVRVRKLQNRTFASPGEIRILSSGKIRIFTGSDFSGLKPILIDGELNSEWKIGLTLENWSTETGVMVFWSFFDFHDFCWFLARMQTYSLLTYIFGFPMTWWFQICKAFLSNFQFKNLSFALGPVWIGSYGLVKLLLVINNLTYTAATAALCRNALFLWLILLFFMTWKTPGLILVMTSSPLPFLQLDHDADYFTTSCYMLQRAGEPLLLTGEKPYRSKIRWLASSSPNLAKGSVSSAISNVFYYLATPLLLRCRFKTRFCPVSKQQLLLLFCF